MTEAIANPWMERNGDFEFKGVIYPSEVTLEILTEM
jgi:hypothetical protein